MPGVDAGPDPRVLVWPPGRLTEIGRLPEVGNGTSGAFVDVPADCAVSDDAWLGDWPEAILVCVGSPEEPVG